MVTNSLGIPASLPGQAVRDLFVLGGEYRAESHITIGSVTCCGSTGVSVDSAILGVGGIAREGLFAKLLQEATMTYRMMAAAREPSSWQTRRNSIKNCSVTSPRWNRSMSWPPREPPPEFPKFWRGIRSSSRYRSTFKFETNGKAGD